MKKIFTLLLMCCFCLPSLMAQSNANKDDKKDGDKLIPISREQAEELVTKIVEAEYANEMKSNQINKIVLKAKMDALKRKLLDNALRKAYTSETNERLDRLEKLLYLSLLSKDGKIDPHVLQAILGPGAQQQPGSVLAFQQPQGKEGTDLATPVAPTCPNAEASALNVPDGNGNVETVYVTSESMESFLKQVFFDFDSSELSAESVSTLDEMVQLLNANPTLKVVLKGYASPEGNLKYNNKLSGRRVKACSNYLIEHGIDRSRLEVEPSGIDSMKASYPAARRVDIRPAFCN